MPTMNVMQSSFLDELWKLAKPRWVEEYQKLSPENQARLMGNVPEKVRELKHLGEGSERISDLVYHPAYGAVVRKTPLLGDGGQRYDIGQTLDRAQKQVGFENRLREVAGDQGQFTHLLGADPNKRTAYYQYAGADPEARAMIAKEKAHMARFAEIRKEMGQNNVPTLAQAAELEQLSRSQNAVARWAHADMPLSPETEGVMDKLRQEYPAMGMADVRRMNVVNGKIVDMSPGPVQVFPDGALPREKGKVMKGTDFSKRMVYGSDEDRKKLMPNHSSDRDLLNRGFTSGAQAPDLSQTAPMAAVASPAGWGSRAVNFLQHRPGAAMLAGGGIGAGLGAGIGAATGEEGTRGRRAIIGAGIGGAAGVGAAGLGHLLAQRL